jgi:hypothetical protein
MLGIEKIKTTPYHHQLDCFVERFNRTLPPMIGIFVSKILLAGMIYSHFCLWLIELMNTKVQSVDQSILLIVGTLPKTPREEFPMQYMQWLQEILLKKIAKVSQHPRQTASRQSLIMIKMQNLGKLKLANLFGDGIS